MNPDKYDMLATTNHLENRLWDVADQLRANSNLNSSEYFMPVMGLIFLRHAYNRFVKVKAEIEPTLPTRNGVARPLTKEDFEKKNALFLREEARFDTLLNLPSDDDIGEKIIAAMQTIEEDYPQKLEGVLPKEYARFDNELLGKLLKIFNDEALRNGNGDVFGRIYEYFLMKFSMQRARDEGEFFTPISLVQMIVNVIEPDKGIVFDPACGSGGMFVQTSHFLEQEGKDVNHDVTFYGQEKSATTIRLATMNLAVHGLDGKILEGNTFYQDRHNLVGKANYVMANPPFNVNGVDAEKAKADTARLAFGLPGVNKKGEVSNGNYLWISYFYSYLNATGRAGFVMSSQASSAGGDEQKVRQKLVESGCVDVMIGIRSNFFYTRTVPCELWFLNRAKPEHLRNKVLMLDARSIFRKVDRRVYDFSPEQLKNLTAIVWLYRGKQKAFLQLITEYFSSLVSEGSELEPKLTAFEATLQKLQGQLSLFQQSLTGEEDLEPTKVYALQDALTEFEESFATYMPERQALLASLGEYLERYGQNLPADNQGQHTAREAFTPIADQLRSLTKQVDLLYKLLVRCLDLAEKDLGARSHEAWNNREASQLRKSLLSQRNEAAGELREILYFYRQIVWLQERFPEATLRDVEGLVKLVGLEEIESNDWSLTPGRYVGIAPEEIDEDFDFEEALRSIHQELIDLNEEASELSLTIMRNFQGLGI